VCYKFFTVIFMISTPSLVKNSYFIHVINKKKKIVVQCSAVQDIFYLIMEPKVSLLCSQEPITKPYPKRDEPNPHHFCKMNLNIILQSVFSGIVNKILHEFLIFPAWAACPTSHLPWFDHPDNIRRILNLWSSSLCNFLHLTATSSLLGPDSLLITYYLKHP
jgi:hypothetical protein